MKDKELRSALEDSGVVKTVMDRDGGEFLQVLDVEKHLNAICEYLEIKLSRAPERIIAKRKNAPQNTVEAKPPQATNTASLKLPRYEDCMSGINGCENWCASEEWVAGCKKMYDYISRQLQA